MVAPGTASAVGPYCMIEAQSYGPIGWPSVMIAKFVGTEAWLATAAWLNLIDPARSGRWCSR